MKSLLVAEDNANKLFEKIKSYETFEFLKQSKQRNHYFINGNFETLAEELKDKFTSIQINSLQEIIKQGKNFSVRTRDTNEKVLVVIKASIDETNSSNGTARLEFEEQVELPINELDAILIKHNFKYHLKFSRERNEYSYKDLTVCIDKNSGYGYLAEFEKVVNNENPEKVKEYIRNEMEILGVKELDQDKINAMFEYYSKHWEEYYMTEKVFVL